MDTKRCVGCGETKPVSEFHKQAKQTDGYRPRCKVCRKVESVVWYRDNSAVIKKRTQRWQQEHSEQYRAYLKEWYANNKDRKQALDRRYNAEHREERKAYQQRPEVMAKARQNTKNQKAKRKLAMGATHHPITAAEWADLKAEYLFRCVYCGALETTEEPLTQDHIVPLKQGGDHSLANIVPACGRCNREKHTMSLVEYMLYRKRHQGA